ncbi:S-methyl-5-thioribose-1-phosphate isomerase [Actinoallomurus rhizosphaericola]|uniref:S-methyl-5-thioribose-1-phosphate isomerase n=1 Tax=Actinoallomurus rhizosphaericola TaxID=2952536 RepID=UPI00209292DF|nr:S-methyl-5-thioribose-1-phosphate isomerase [Actinoallomurus rhizosphaericola]MCO5998752.1 S-methyl-5-thioribose-1-phosphate isomerase [Actinoallomurus rhizosphaericola]
MDVLRWSDPPEGPALLLLDQTRLPHEEVVLVCREVPDVVRAIKDLAVRGAPLLGIAAGYGVALAVALGEDVEAAARDLAGARPTAVNLARGAERVLHAHQEGRSALSEAHAIADEEAAYSARMAEHGLELVPDGGRVLTHCNTGALAAGGDGTALGVVIAAHRAGRLARLWVDETRPLLQGARLTAYEAARHGLPYTLLPDGAAASLFAAGEVDLVVLGADRIARDGSVANKVGTYSLAVLARHHGVPFVVVAPTSTVDLTARTGDDIPIELRDPGEVAAFAGQPTAPLGSPVYNPAFDVTPGDLVTAIVTERGVISPVNEGTLAALGDPPPITRR